MELLGLLFLLVLWIILYWTSEHAGIDYSLFLGIMFLLSGLSWILSPGITYSSCDSIISLTNTTGNITEYYYTEKCVPIEVLSPLFTTHLAIILLFTGLIMIYNFIERQKVNE